MVVTVDAVTIDVVETIVEAARPKALAVVGLQVASKVVPREVLRGGQEVRGEDLLVDFAAVRIRIGGAMNAEAIAADAVADGVGLTLPT